MNKGQREIMEILMRRDGISRNEAFNIVQQCQEEINDIVMDGGNIMEAEDVIADYLGLEPDYLVYFLEP